MAHIPSTQNFQGPKCQLTAQLASCFWSCLAWMTALTSDGCRLRTHAEICDLHLWAFWQNHVEVQIVTINPSLALSWFPVVEPSGCSSEQIGKPGLTIRSGTSPVVIGVCTAVIAGRVAIAVDLQTLLRRRGNSCCVAQQKEMRSSEQLWNYSPAATRIHVL